jgi:hypothetical protein
MPVGEYLKMQQAALLMCDLYWALMEKSATGSLLPLQSTFFDCSSYYGFLATRDECVYRFVDNSALLVGVEVRLGMQEVGIWTWICLEVD